MQSGSVSCGCFSKWVSQLWLFLYVDQSAVVVFLSGSVSCGCFSKWVG